MSGLSHAQKLAFVREVLELLKMEQSNLLEKGVDVSQRIATLENESSLAEGAEAEQQKASSASKDATRKALTSIRTAYRDASDAVDQVAGTLGKNSELVKTIRGIRDSMNKVALRGKRQTPPPV